MILFFLFLFIVVGACWAGWRRHVANQKKLVCGKPELDRFKLPAADDPRWSPGPNGNDYCLGQFRVWDGEVWFHHTKIGPWAFYAETVIHSVEERQRAAGRKFAASAVEHLRQDQAA